jgi:hypothetical protein
MPNLLGSAIFAKKSVQVKENDTGCPSFPGGAQ